MRPLDWIVLNAAVNSTANLEEKQGKLLTVGNSTEGALLLWLREAGLDYAAMRKQIQPLYQVHFSSERKRMTTVVRYGDRLIVGYVSHCALVVFKRAETQVEAHVEAVGNGNERARRRRAVSRIAKHGASELADFLLVDCA